MPDKIHLIRSIYLYLVSLIALVMIIFSMADLVNLSLKTWIFTQADKADYYTPVCSESAPSTLKSEEAKPPGKETCEEIEKQEKKGHDARKQSSAVRDLSFILIGLPLFLFHWQLVKKEKEEKK